MAQPAQKEEGVKAVVALVDEKLAHHLKHAEEHMIEAVKLFELKDHPKRTISYIARLTRAQEMVTALFRDELIRKRGPIKITAAVGKRKK